MGKVNWSLLVVGDENEEKRGEDNSIYLEVMMMTSLVIESTVVM